MLAADDDVDDYEKKVIFSASFLSKEFFMEFSAFSGDGGKIRNS